VSLPLGFRFASTYAGIRKRQADDLTFIVSDVEAAAAAVFTQNAVRAAPVTLTAEHLKKSKGRCRAIVANAGNANCATSTMGKVAKATAVAASKLLGVPSHQILLASTGVIGEPLDPRKIIDQLPDLYRRLAPEGFESSARAIMTTDTVPKVAYAELKTDIGTIRLAGMAKGSGMIHPRMATMLAFLFTDADIEAAPLQKILRSVVGRTFNCISVDSDTSTNDTVYLLANGQSGVRVKSHHRAAFEAALRLIAEQLAVAIARDGEGARKLLTIDVEGAANDSDAQRLARAIANSPLVKTALAGADPNWGRILSSAGAGSIPFDPAKIDIRLNGHLVCRRGCRANFSEEKVQASMEASECMLHFRIGGSGKGKARFWTCDMTEAYIRINAEYRT
jgi:glutamate N-acetyltransferase/amino-acid N-acetyltransferase